MKLEKEIWKNLLFPKTVVVFFLFNIAAVLLVYSLAVPEAYAFIQYGSYVFSTYVLTVVVLHVPQTVKKVKKLLHSNKYVSKFITDKYLRFVVILAYGSGINIIFGIFKIVMGILYESAWLMAVGIYYIVLSMIRATLLLRNYLSRKQETKEQQYRYQLKSCRACGMMMLALDVTMTGMIIQMVWKGEGYTYPGLLIYASAAFAFYALTMAIIGLVKNWHIKNPIFSANKRIALATAMMSVLALQTALITQFGGEGSAEFRRLMNALTGTAVCVTILWMAAGLIHKANKELKMIDTQAG